MPRKNTSLQLVQSGTCSSARSRRFNRVARVVMNNADDTAIMAKAYGKKAIAGRVMRMPTGMGRL